MGLRGVIHSFFEVGSSYNDPSRWFQDIIPEPTDQLEVFSEDLMMYILSLLDSESLGIISRCGKKYHKLVVRLTQNLLVWFENRDVKLRPQIRDILYYSLRRQSTASNPTPISETKLKLLVAAGIPRDDRWFLWQHFTGAWDLRWKNPDLFPFLLKRSSSVLPHISRDVPRTFPNHPYFASTPGQQHLQNVLNAYANFNQRKGVRYCQGFNNIAGILLLAESDTEAAFWTMVQIMKTDFFVGIYEVNHSDCYQFLQTLIDRHLPRISEHFKSEGIVPEMFSKSWLLTAFSTVLPLRLVLRIWDIMMANSWTILMQVTLALLDAHTDALLEQSQDEILSHLGLRHVPENSYNDEAIILKALSFDVPSQPILTSEHSTEL